MAPAKTRLETNRQMVEAAFVCDLVRVRELLAAGADPNARDDEGRAPLHQAVLGNSVGLVDRFSVPLILEPPTLRPLRLLEASK